MIDEYPSHPIIIEAYLLKGKIHKELKQYDESLKFYKKIVTEKAGAAAVPFAIYQLGVLYQDCLKNNDEAAHYYKKLIMLHPGSIQVTNAAKRLRVIRNQDSL